MAAKKTMSRVETGKLVKPAQKRNAWKIVAAVFICLFLVILALGIAREYRFLSTNARATQEQMDAAWNAVGQYLKDRGNSIYNYTVYVSGNVRGPAPAGMLGMGRSVMQVSLDGNSTRQTFIIDIESGQIVMHSQTEFYGWMQGMRTRGSGPGFGGASGLIGGGRNENRY